jgi:hypothetical protein
MTFCTVPITVPMMRMVRFLWWRKRASLSFWKFPSLR